MTTTCPPNLTEPNLTESNRTKVVYVDFEKQVHQSWNTFCDKFPSLSKINEITGSRRDKLKKRYEKQSFQDFNAILQAIEKQSFLLHGNPDSKDHQNWKVSFDWLIDNDTNYVKVLELKYVDNKHSDIPEHLRPFIKKRC